MLRAVSSGGSGGGNFTTAVSFPITTVSTNTTLDGTMFTLQSNDASGTLTHSLPAAATCSGRVYNIKKIGASNTTVIDPNGAELIDGASTLTLTTQYQNAMIQSTGTGWVIL